MVFKHKIYIVFRANTWTGSHKNATAHSKNKLQLGEINTHSEGLLCNSIQHITMD